MLDLFYQSGHWGWLLIIYFICTAPLTLGALFIKKKMWMIIVLILLSCFPILIGASGTMIANYEIERIIAGESDLEILLPEQPIEYSEEMIQRFKESAQSALKIGAGFASPMFILTFINIFFYIRSKNINA